MTIPIHCSAPLPLNLTCSCFAVAHFVASRLSDRRSCCPKMQMRLLPQRSWTIFLRDSRSIERGAKRAYSVWRHVAFTSRIDREDTRNSPQTERIPARAAPRSRQAASNDRSRRTFDRLPADKSADAARPKVEKDKSLPSGVSLTINGEAHVFSPLLLRDLCTCPRCVDASTRQKLFSTTDIPADIQAASVDADSNGDVSVRWLHDAPGFGEDHVSRFEQGTLHNLIKSGLTQGAPPHMPKRLWNAEVYRNEVQDIDYAAYMQDDRSLLTALQALHTHGLLFLTNVPESDASVSTIAERIGPVKNTFYGYTWDVRSVAEAKNVAYTSQDLGFHMDLLYMEQPPHLQFLHCIRSSSAGGASLSTDSFKAATDLFAQDPEAFQALHRLPVNFHYDHPRSHFYRQERRVIEPRPRRLGEIRGDVFAQAIKRASESGTPLEGIRVVGELDAVSWAPPFQAPVLPVRTPTIRESTARNLLENANAWITPWHAAAGKFNALIHRPEGIYERMMKPGECVIFDNRRVLHARKAFEVADVGKERWLRGAYLDKDPYLSKLEVLQQRFRRDLEPMHDDAVTQAALSATA